MVEEEDKKVCKFISDCAGDIAFSGLIDCVVGTETVSLASETINNINHLTSKEIARNGMSEVAKELIISSQVASDMQNFCNVANNVKDALELLKPINHKTHLNQGINYLADCEVCND